MVFSKAVCVLSELMTSNVKCFKVPLDLFGLTCGMACVVRAVYVILFIIVAFPIFNYSHQAQGDSHCNAVLRKDSNSIFSSFLLPVCSLLLPSATKAVRVGAHRDGFMFFLTQFCFTF